MSSGLYPNTEVVERSASAVGAVAQTFVAPYDADVLGILISCSANATAALTCNITSVLTSQQGPYASGITPANPNPVIPAPGLWTAANVPTVLTGNRMNIVPSTPIVVQNQPYALSYPFPGPAGTTGFVTAQQTTPFTSAPVTAPPQVLKAQMSQLVPPDNTYTDVNGQVNSPCSFVHYGDVLTLVLGGTAAGTMQLELILAKR